MLHESNNTGPNPENTSYKLSEELEHLMWNKNELIARVRLLVESRALKPLLSLVSNQAEVSEKQFQRFEQYTKRLRNTTDDAVQVIEAAAKRGDVNALDIADAVKKGVAQLQSDVREFITSIVAKDNGDTLEYIRESAASIERDFKLQDLTDDNLLELTDVIPAGAQLSSERLLKIHQEELSENKNLLKTTEKTIEGIPQNNLEVDSIDIPPFKWSWTDEELFGNKKIPPAVLLSHEYEQIQENWKQTQSEMILGFKNWKGECLNKMKNTMLTEASTRKSSSLSETLDILETAFTESLTKIGDQVFKFFSEPFFNTNQEKAVSSLIENFKKFCRIEGAPDPIFIKEATESFFERSSKGSLVGFPTIESMYLGKDPVWYFNTRYLESMQSGRNIVIKEIIRAEKPVERLANRIIEELKEDGLKLKGNLIHQIYESVSELEKILQKHLSEVIPLEIITRNRTEDIQKWKTALKEALFAIEAFKSATIDPCVLMKIKNAASRIITYNLKDKALRVCVQCEWVDKSDGMAFEKELRNFSPTVEELLPNSELVPTFKRKWTGEEILKYMPMPRIFQSKLTTFESEDIFTQFELASYAAIDDFYKKYKTKHSNQFAVREAHADHTQMLSDSFAKVRKNLFPENACLYASESILSVIVGRDQYISFMSVFLPKEECIRLFDEMYVKMFCNSEEINCGIPDEECSEDWMHFCFKSLDNQKLAPVFDPHLEGPYSADSVINKYLVNQGIDIKHPEIQQAVNRGNKVGQSLIEKISLKRLGMELMSNFFEAMNEIQYLQIEGNQIITGHIRNALSLWLSGVYSLHYVCTEYLTRSIPNDPDVRRVYTVKALEVDFRPDEEIEETIKSSIPNIEQISNWSDKKLFIPKKLPIISQTPSIEIIWQSWKELRDKLKQANDEHAQKIADKSIAMPSLNVVVNGTKKAVLPADSFLLANQSMIKSVFREFDFIFKYGLATRCFKEGMDKIFKRLIDYLMPVSMDSKKSDELVTAIQSFYNIIVGHQMIFDIDEDCFETGSNTLFVRKTNHVVDHRDFFSDSFATDIIDTSKEMLLPAGELDSPDRNSKQTKKELERFKQILLKVIRSFPWEDSYQDGQSLIEDIRKLQSIFLFEVTQFQTGNILISASNLKRIIAFAIARSCKEGALILLSHFDEEHGEKENAIRDFSNITNEEISKAGTNNLMRNSTINFVPFDHVAQIWEESVGVVNSDNNLSLNLYSDLLKKGKQGNIEWYKDVSEFALLLSLKEKSKYSFVDKELEAQQKSELIRQLNEFLFKIRSKFKITTVHKAEIIERIKLFSLIYKGSQNSARKFGERLEILCELLPDELDFEQIQALIEVAYKALTDYQIELQDKEIVGITLQEQQVHIAAKLEWDCEMFSQLRNSLRDIFPYKFTCISIGNNNGSTETNGTELDASPQKILSLHPQELDLSSNEILDTHLKKSPITKSDIFALINRIQKFANSKKGGFHRQVLSFRGIARRGVSIILSDAELINSTKKYEEVIRFIYSAVDYSSDNFELREILKQGILEERKLIEPSVEPNNDANNIKPNEIANLLSTYNSQSQNTIESICNGLEGHIAISVAQTLAANSEKLDSDALSNISRGTQSLIISAKKILRDALEKTDLQKITATELATIIANSIDAVTTNLTIHPLVDQEVKSKLDSRKALIIQSTSDDFSIVDTVMNVADIGPTQLAQNINLLKTAQSRSHELKWSADVNRVEQTAANGLAHLAFVLEHYSQQAKSASSKEEREAALADMKRLERAINTILSFQAMNISSETPNNNPESNANT